LTVKTAKTRNKEHFSENRQTKKATDVPSIKYKD